MENKNIEFIKKYINQKLNRLNYNAKQILPALESIYKKIETTDSIFTPNDRHIITQSSTLRKEYNALNRKIEKNNISNEINKTNFYDLDKMLKLSLNISNKVSYKNRTKDITISK